MTRVLAVTLRGYGSLLMVLCLAFCARPVSDISAVIPSGSVRSYETTEPGPPWPPLGAGSVSAHPPLPSSWSSRNTRFYLTSSTSGFVLHARAVLREHVYELASKASTVGKGFIGTYRSKTDRFSEFSRLAVLYHEPFITRTSPRSAFIPPTRTTSVDNPALPTAGHVWRKSAVPVDVDAPTRRQPSLWLHDGVLGNFEPRVRRSKSINLSYIALGVLALFVCLSVVSKVLTSSSAPAGIIDFDDELEIHCMLPSHGDALSPGLGGALSLPAEWKELVGMDVNLEVVFSLPGLPGGPVVYSSHGFVEQEASSSLSIGELLDDLIALEQSTLEPFSPYLPGATVEVRLEVAVGAYTVVYDRSGAEYVIGANLERRGVWFCISYLPRAQQSTAPVHGLILNGGNSEVSDVHRPLTIQYVEFSLVRVVVDHSGVCSGLLILVPDEIFVTLLYGAQRPALGGSTRMRPPLLIEWVSRMPGHRGEVQEPLTVVQSSTTRSCSQRPAQSRDSVCRPGIHVPSINTMFGPRTSAYILTDAYGAFDPTRTQPRPYRFSSTTGLGPNSLTSFPLGPSLSPSLTCSVESREMVGMEVNLQIKFLLPGLPDEPIIYSSTGFVEQEASSSLSMSSLLENIISLERSTLGAVCPHLRRARVEARLEVAVGAYTAFYDRSGAKYVTGANPERRGVQFSVSYLPCAQLTAPTHGLIHGGDCGNSEIPDVCTPITIQYFRFPLIQVVVDHPSVCYGPVILVPDEIFAILLFGTQRLSPSGSTQVRPPLLIEWVSEKSSLQSEVQEPPAAPVAQPPTTRVRPQRAARPGHSVYRPPRFQQANLTEERRLERARQQQLLLEQAERELEAAEAATEEPGKRKRGRRGGRQARERAERRDFHALAATEYVRGE